MAGKSVSDTPATAIGSSLKIGECDGDGVGGGGLVGEKRKGKGPKERAHHKKAKGEEGRPEVNQPGRLGLAGPAELANDEYNPFSRIKRQHDAVADTSGSVPASECNTVANTSTGKKLQEDAAVLSSRSIPSEDRSRAGGAGRLGPMAAAQNVMAMSARKPASVKALPSSVRDAVNSNWLKLKATLVPDPKPGRRRRRVSATGAGDTGDDSSLRKAEAAAKSLKEGRTSFQASAGPAASTAAAAVSAKGKPDAFPLVPNVGEGILTKVVALDCEMVGVGEGGRRSAPAHVCIVNSHGQIIYEKHVRTLEKVTDYKTFVSGVRPKDLRKGHAEDLEVVRKEVGDLLRGRVLVGHSLRHDLRALMLGHPWRMIRDTQNFERFKGQMGRKRSLKSLAEEHLNMQIQTGEHSPSEDACAALYLYLKYRKEWEQSLHQKTAASAAPNTASSSSLVGK